MLLLKMDLPGAMSQKSYTIYMSGSRVCECICVFMGDLQIVSREFALSVGVHASGDLQLSSHRHKLA